MAHPQKGLRSHCDLSQLYALLLNSGKTLCGQSWVGLRSQEF